MARIVLRGYEILEIAHKQFPSDIDNLCGNCKMLLADLINSSQKDAYYIGVGEAESRAAQAVARKKIEDEKPKM